MLRGSNILDSLNGLAILMRREKSMIDCFSSEDVDVLYSDKVIKYNKLDVIREFEDKPFE